MKLTFAVLDPRAQSLTVVGERRGTPRRVVLTWQSHTKMPLPANWFEMVRMELDEQDSLAAAAAEGRTLL